MWFFIFFSISGDSLMEEMRYKLGNFKDRIMEIRMETEKEDGKKSLKKVKIWEKGKLRMIKFTYPRDMKGIGILILKMNEIYLWMPSYAGVKRITSSTVYTNFMGTDFSYAELTGEFYKRFKVKKVDEKDGTYIITLYSNDVSSPYKLLKLFLDKETTSPDSIKFYRNRLKKIIRIKEKKEMDGCIIPFNIVVENPEKSTKTKIIIENVKLNTGLSDGFFTRRNLRRMR